MIAALEIGESDDVIEFAPGLGATARTVLARNPHSYTAVERDEKAAKLVGEYVHGPYRRCIQGHAEATGLADAYATIVYGEAMLSMQPESNKRKVLAEAHRLLRYGGRYGIHELCLTPDDLPDDRRAEIERDLSQAIHVGVRPLTVREWRQLLEQAGFTIEQQAMAPMHLLEPRRLLADEGLGNALRFAWRALRDREARARMLEMRRAFRKHAAHLGAVALTARKTV
jgi:ubiquinone/menaquinone biosynthesis C-methylase UbiE